MASRTIENYLKQIYLSRPADETQWLTMGKLSAAVGVTPGTATSMVRAISDAHLVEYEPRAGVRLTPAGEQLALHVLRRHRLIELLLVQVLGLDWSEVHEEAEELEHVVSDRLLARIDEILQHPAFDPHGDPIPTAGGVVRSQDCCTLLDCPLGSPTNIARILDQSADFLQYVNQCGLLPGADIRVASRNHQAQTVELLVIKRGENHVVAISFAVAEKFLVQMYDRKK
ncbi:MAG: metal-dependent transcriptional regulator [Phycisphaerae bacterium]|nr:metal-dependent transcriptional regulator [Phycisphaerae bacterium]